MVLYSELAAMFPSKSGGFPIYANEGWRKYTTLVGPVATFGYWIGWSVVLSYLGLFTGYIAQAAWFPHEKFGTYAFGGAKIDNGYFSTGSVHIGLQHLIAIGLVVGGLHPLDQHDGAGRSHGRSGSEDRGGVRLRRRSRQARRFWGDQLLRRRHMRQLHPVDEHGDRRRQPRPLRHLEGRLDHQGT